MISTLSSTIICEFMVNSPKERFIAEFWNDKNVYEMFLVKELDNKDVVIEDWVHRNSEFQSRMVHSSHPSKISFPGLPSHAKNIRTQEIFSSSKGNDPSECVCIHESISFQGIPYADYFSVSVYWRISDVVETENPTKQDLRRTNKYALSCQVKISVECKFYKQTWLKSMIESNTISELSVVYEKWKQYINRKIGSNLSSIPAHENINKFEVNSASTGVSFPCRRTENPCATSQHRCAPYNRFELEDNMPLSGALHDFDNSRRVRSDIRGYEAKPSRLNFIPANRDAAKKWYPNRKDDEPQNHNNFQSNKGYERLVSDTVSTDEEVFYDCEEGRGEAILSRIFSLSFSA